MSPPAFADLDSLRFGHTHDNNFKKTLNGNLATNLLCAWRCTVSSGFPLFLFWWYHHMMLYSPASVYYPSIIHPSLVRVPETKS